MLATEDALVSLDLEEGSGSVAINGVSSESDGQIVGGATYSTDTRDGSSYSLRFDGTMMITLIWVPSMHVAVGLRWQRGLKQTVSPVD